MTNSQGRSAACHSMSAGTGSLPRCHWALRKCCCKRWQQSYSNLGFFHQQTHDRRAPSPYPEVFMVLDLKSSRVFWDFQKILGKNVWESLLVCPHSQKQHWSPADPMLKRCMERCLVWMIPIGCTCVTAKRAAASRTKAQRASKAIGTAPVD